MDEGGHVPRKCMRSFLSTCQPRAETRSAGPVPGAWVHANTRGAGGPEGRASDRSQAGWDLLYVISTGTLAKQIYKIVSRRISFYLSRVNLKHKSHVFKYHHVLVFYDISEIRLWECSVLQMLGELKLGKERSWRLLRALWVWSSMPGVRLQTHVRLA